MNSDDESINDLWRSINDINPRTFVNKEAIEILIRDVKELKTIVAGLNLGGCKYGKLKEESLEELTEPPISENEPISENMRRAEACKVGDSIFIEDVPAFRRELREYNKTRAGCQGDQLGQCEPGCDGVSRRGSCLDEAWTDKHGNEHVVVAPSPVDNVQSCSLEDEAVSHVSYGHVSPYAHVAPREPVDNDDTKYGKDGDSRLEGSSEGRVGEQKANMSDSRAKGRVWGLSDGVSCDCFTLGLRHVALPAVVYCCNGAMYEAR